MSGCAAIEQTFNTDWSCGNSCEVLCKCVVVVGFLHLLVITVVVGTIVVVVKLFCNRSYNRHFDPLHSIFLWLSSFISILSLLSVDEASGISTDWMMETVGMLYAFAPELRGSGFVVDPDQIPLSTEEVWNGLVAMVKAIMVIPSPKHN